MPQRGPNAGSLIGRGVPKLDGTHKGAGQLERRAKTVVAPQKSSPRLFAQAKKHHIGPSFHQPLEQLRVLQRLRGHRHVADLLATLFP